MIFEGENFSVYSVLQRAPRKRFPHGIRYVILKAMAKTLCEWKKHEILEETEELLRIVGDPRFVCRKCARAAHQEKHLCKPIPLPLKEAHHHLAHRGRNRDDEE